MALDLGVRRVEALAEAPSDATVPVPGSQVTVAYTGRLPEGTVFDTSSRADTETVSFTLGDANVTAGLNIAVASMRVGERIVFELPPAAAWGSAGLPSKGVPPDSTVLFDVTLVAVEPPTAAPPSAPAPTPAAPAPASPALPPDYNPCADATLLKDHGNARLRAGDASGAYYKYRQALQFLDLPAPSAGPLAERDAYDALLRPLRIALHGNASQAALALGRNPEALEAADAVLAAEPRNEKALFRRAKALQGLSRLPEALEAVDTLLRLRGDNSAALALHQQLAPPAPPAGEAPLQGSDAAQGSEGEGAVGPASASADDVAAKVATAPTGPVPPPTPPPAAAASDADAGPVAASPAAASAAAPAALPSNDAPAAAAPRPAPAKQSAGAPNPLASAARKAFGSLYEDKPAVNVAALSGSGGGPGATGPGSFVAALLEGGLGACETVARWPPLSWCGCRRAVRGVRKALGMMPVGKEARPAAPAAGAAKKKL